MNKLILDRIPVNSKVLTLNLCKEAFELTGKSFKMFELRKDSKFIRDRLFEKGYSGVVVKKRYDYVLLVWGYGDNRPFKLFHYVGFRMFDFSQRLTFSPTLFFDVLPGDYCIYLENEIIF